MPVSPNLSGNLLSRDRAVNLVHVGSFDFELSLSLGSLLLSKISNTISYHRGKLAESPDLNSLVDENPVPRLNPMRR